MKFATRLYLGFAIMILIVSILLMVNISISSKHMKEIDDLVQERYTSNQEMAMEEILQQTEDRLNTAIMTGVSSIGLGIIFGIALSYWSIHKITLRLRTVKEVMNSVENGSEDLPRIQVTTEDEIGEIARAYNHMATALETHEKNERIYKEGIEEQNWLKTQIAEVTTYVHEFHDVNSLGQLFVQNIVPIVGASYGVLYINRKEENENVLYKLASYANCEAKEKIMEGEDLVGQCFKDGRIIKLNNIPDDFIKIASGLGETNPKNMIILPIKINSETIGVIEIASIYEFNESHEYLLQRTTYQFGNALNRIQKQKQVQQLLEETQALNDELQSQSEELQLQQEELTTMNERLEVQYKQSEQRSADLEEAKLKLEEKTQQVLISSQYKSEFLANMSHELRTPLNSLLILAQILQENKEGNLNEKQVEYTNTIFSSGKELLNLINEILDLSKIESGKVEFQNEKVEVSNLVKFIKSQFTAIAEQKGISFNVMVEENTPNYLYSDEQKMYQILINLISNGIKFTEKGNVTLKIGVPQSTGIQNEQTYLLFSVSDTGIGIPEEKQKLIFEAFRQADGTTSRKYGGTGLGLSISKGMAELLGGYLTVNSVEGQGSTFYFYLPLYLDENVLAIERFEVASTIESTVDNKWSFSSIEGEKTSHSIINKDNVLPGKNILIVDDDMRNVFALTTALEPYGINILFSENGLEAIELLENHSHVDLILMDIMMPEMDGYEAMKIIRGHAGMVNLPIIALTAKAMKDDREKCIEAGASDYISKPVNVEQLISLLKVWLYD